MEKLPRGRLTVFVDSPGFGGSEQDLFRMLDLVSDAEVLLVCSSLASPKFVENIPKSCQIIRYTPVPNGASNIVRGLLSAGRLFRKLRPRASLVWAHHSDSCRWIQVVLALTGANFAIAERALAPDRHSLKRSRSTQPIKRFVYSRARKIIFCGAAQQAQFSDYFNPRPERIVNVPNCRDVRSIGSRVAVLRQGRESLKARLGLCQKRMVVCVARLVKEKGIHVLTDAMRFLECDDAGLVLVGDGPDREWIEGAIVAVKPGRVTFAGYRDDPLPWLAAADLFAFPSFGEGLSGALIEAMCAGLPCVVSDIAGNRELIQHEKTGLVVRPGDAAALGCAINRVFRDNGLSTRLGSEALAYVREHHDSGIERKGWREVFSDFID